MRSALSTEGTIVIQRILFVTGTKQVNFFVWVSVLERKIVLFSDAPNGFWLQKGGTQIEINKYISRSVNGSSLPFSFTFF